MSKSANSLVHQLTESNSWHHCLSRQVGGSHHASNKTHVSDAWHYAYNELELTQNGFAQPTRVIARYCIMNIARLRGVLEPKLLREILQITTPSRWQDAYEKQALSDDAASWKYDIQKNSRLHQTARNFAVMINQERTIVSDSVQALSTTHSNGIHKILNPFEAFFAAKHFSKIVREIVNTDALTRAMSIEARNEILDRTYAPLVSPSKITRGKIIDVLDEHSDTLDHAFRSWWPVKRQFTIAKERIVHLPLREQNKRIKKQQQ